MLVVLIAFLIALITQKSIIRHEKLESLKLITQEICDMIVIIFRTYKLIKLTWRDSWTNRIDMSHIVYLGFRCLELAKIQFFVETISFKPRRQKQWSWLHPSKRKCGGSCTGNFSSSAAQASWWAVIVGQGSPHQLKDQIFESRIDVLMWFLDMWVRTPRGVATYWHLVQFQRKT